MEQLHDERLIGSIPKSGPASKPRARSIQSHEETSEEDNEPTRFINAYNLARTISDPPKFPDEQDVTPSTRTNEQEEDIQAADLLHRRLHDGPLQPRHAGAHLRPRRQRRLRPRPVPHLPRRPGRHRPGHGGRLVRRRRRQPSRRVPRRGLAQGGPRREPEVRRRRPRPQQGGAKPEDTIRRYLATGFYKHHLQTYKRRPIYWLFSSGKQRAFQCLVYLHRYHDGTLARMRTEYVIPLQGKIVARIEKLEDDKAKATSTSHRNKLQKEQDNLKKQQAELLVFEEKLKHAADQRIQPRPRRRREGELRQVRRPAGRGQGRDGRERGRLATEGHGRNTENSKGIQRFFRVPSVSIRGCLEEEG